MLKVIQLEKKHPEFGGKDKGKVHATPGHKCPDGNRSIALLFL
jgi:hypothetical protein